MTNDTWLAFAATAIFLILLPSPLACLTASFSLQRGRRTAVATVPGLAIGLSIAFLMAVAPLALVSLYLPRLLETLSWVSLGYLMFYILWSYQDPRISGPIADNDNLPECRPARIFGCLVGKSVFGPRYAAVLAAVLVQFIDPGRPLLPQILEMQATFLACVALGAGIHILFPRRVLGRRRRASTLNPASRKPQTRFISRRAVTAGYRRIAA
ncbi:LysE family translocator [Rhizobium puerariae]|uniref:LysE family translocator n=1 Tax=Rhizobium puerariae TaxID=1585791 RepID=A0ABV6AR41_9HYPH